MSESRKIPTNNLHQPGSGASLDESVAKDNDRFRKYLLPELVDFSTDFLSNMSLGEIDEHLPFRLIEHIRNVDASVAAVPAVRNEWGIYWNDDQQYFWQIRYLDRHGNNIDDIHQIRKFSKELNRTIDIYDGQLDSRVR